MDKKPEEVTVSEFIKLKDCFQKEWCWDRTCASCKYREECDEGEGNLMSELRLCMKWAREHSKEDIYEL